ncbi:MAG: hypothetical protein QM744_02695 [Mesorhizobium sp.]
MSFAEVREKPMGVNIQRWFDTEVDKERTAAVKAALEADALEDGVLENAKDEQLSQQNARIDFLSAQVEALKNLEGKNYDLSTQLVVKTAENAILRETIEKLRAKLTALVGPSAPPRPPREFAPPPVADDFAKLKSEVERAAFLTKLRQWYEENTGATGELTPSDIRSITDDGVVYENQSFRGTLRIEANNVTLRNCRVEGGDYNGIDADGADGCVFENVTVIGAPTMNYNNAILAGTNATILRCNVSVHQHAITPQGGPRTLVRHNYVHDGWIDPAAEKHVGGISIKGGDQFIAMLVEGNLVYGQDTSCVFIKNDFGSVKNTTVQNNFLLNQPGKKTAYTAYSGMGGAKGIVSGTKFLGNVMERGSYGYFSVSDNPDCIIQGNLDALTGANVDGM